MEFKALRLLLLMALLAAQVGCATTRETSDDSVPGLEPGPEHDDSHGWGANLQGAGQ